jgi:hypothetical protein
MVRLQPQTRSLGPNEHIYCNGFERIGPGGRLRATLSARAMQVVFEALGGAHLALITLDVLDSIVRFRARRGLSI